MTKSTPTPAEQFKQERQEAIMKYRDDSHWHAASDQWLDRAFRQKYMYNFTWLGRPIIQLPADMIAFQEIVWSVKPDLIIETGIAHGGSLILSASLLAMLDHADASMGGSILDTRNPKRKVLGIDIDIRSHNRSAIEDHPFAPYITMIQGSSVDASVISSVYDMAKNYKSILVCLDSNHVHDHVLQELQLYAPLVSPGSYCIVFDTIVEKLPDDVFPDRPWSHGNNPASAVSEYLRSLSVNPGKAFDGRALSFVCDKIIDEKLLLSSNPGGYLKRV
jgi:cephalosporin hydroxylase